MQTPAYPIPTAFHALAPMTDAIRPDARQRRGFLCFLTTNPHSLYIWPLPL
ncbi:hypothetical protein [Hymenobacter siberiensis]|uniref:hypothetical protein n=1 Tax=Hymenobacter siberiensis TaxID=2848396 RepID=UPI001C1E45BC|nr:hypothetical protein [Hymenobacter siberiensis]